MINMTNKRDNTLGRAYSFFYCSAPREEIERNLPEARARASTPSDLELTLKQDFSPEDFKGDAQLVRLASEAKGEGNNYVMTATLPNATNGKTASELGDVQNALYQSSLQQSFHRPDGKYIGGIVYKEGRRYEFKE